MVLALHIGAAIALLALALTLVNRFTWARPVPDAARADRTESPAAAAPRLSLLLPARNEGHHIAATLAAASAASGDEVAEILVLDDHSTDDTAARVREAAERDPRIRLLHGRDLPADWAGKPHACHQLAEAARPGTDLLFVDADVRLHPGAPAAIARRLAEGTDVLTAVPRQEVGSPLERLVLPLLHVTYVSWLPLALIPRVRDPRVLAANGQVLGVRRVVFDAIGGFDAIRTALVDDMALCGRAKSAGHRVLFADGHALATCRMYRNAAEVWRGFSKNLFPGLGGSTVALLVVLALHLLAWVLPPLALALWAAGVGAPAWLLPAAVATGAAVVQRGVLALRHGHPGSGVVLHPVAVGVLLAIALNSWWWSVRGRIEWAGRTYDSSGVPKPSAAPAEVPSSVAKTQGHPEA
ncbi:MAG: glycosyltransferase [Deltaproteobacteria bacterium]|nr:MAG: glycosyltransferase [Deltaproteobacteria bacterium]